MRVLVHDFLLQAAARAPERTAVVTEERTLTWAEVDSGSDRIACALQERGVRRGDRVALFLDNTVELCTSIFGVLKAGAVFVVINKSTKPGKLTYLLQDAGVSALIAGAGLARAVRPTLGAVPSLHTTYWVGDATRPLPGIQLAGILAAPHRRPADPGLIDEDLCCLVYTSGSTGEPKGVMLTHRNVANTAWSISTYLANVPDDVVMCLLPLSFGYGLYQWLTAALVGFTLILEKGCVYPYDTLQKIEQHRVTGLPGVPTIFASMLKMAPFDSVDLSSLRYATNAAAAFPIDHIRRLREHLPSMRIFSMYGLTECARVSYLDPDLVDEIPGSVGRAIPNSEVYLVDDAGDRLPNGSTGELVIRGANVMRGYWKKPRETAECLRDGVLRSGDVFRTDEDGFLYFVGRRDELFKCRGEKVSPREVEDVLYALEDVLEAAVVGVDDPVDGQAVKAFVALRAGATATAARIRAHCRARLETHLVPKTVEFSETLPRTATGKIKKSALRAGCNGTGGPRRPGMPHLAGLGSEPGRGTLSLPGDDSHSTPVHVPVPIHGMPRKGTGLELHRSADETPSSTHMEGQAMNVIPLDPHVTPMSQKIQTIREFIVETFLFGEQPDLDQAVSLLGSGTIDSTGVLELILFLEETYGIAVADEDLVPENLDSIERVAQFVERKLAGLAA